jgi:hypothetical protein
MRLLRFFNHSEIKECARDLARRLAVEIPPKMVDQHRKLLSVNKLTRVLERAYEEASDYQKKNGLGFIKRAIFANTFRWELKSSGYSEEFITMATEGLVVKLSKK